MGTGTDALSNTLSIFFPSKSTNFSVIYYGRYLEERREKKIELTYVKQELGDTIVRESEQLQRPLRNPGLNEGTICQIRIAKWATLKSNMKHVGAPRSTQQETF